MRINFYLWLLWRRFGVPFCWHWWCLLLLLLDMMKSSIKRKVVGNTFSFHFCLFCLRANMTQMGRTPEKFFSSVLLKAEHKKKSNGINWYLIRQKANIRITIEKDILFSFTCQNMIIFLSFFSCFIWITSLFFFLSDCLCAPFAALFFESKRVTIKFKVNHSVYTTSLLYTFFIGSFCLVWMNAASSSSSLTRHSSCFALCWISVNQMRNWFLQMLC